jgi:hypothetical protein
MKNGPLQADQFRTRSAANSGRWPVPHPLDLHLCYYSVHTSRAALTEGEREVAGIGREPHAKAVLRSSARASPSSLSTQPGHNMTVISVMVGSVRQVRFAKDPRTLHRSSDEPRRRRRAAARPQGLSIPFFDAPMPSAMATRPAYAAKMEASSNSLGLATQISAVPIA